MTDAQTEARAIVERFPAWPTGWGLELRNRVIEEIATALAAKDAELAKRPDWATVNATYEKWKARAERAEAQLAEARKALGEIEKEAKVSNDVIRMNRDGGGQGRVKVATAMHRIERAARRALTGGQEE